jgi:hypothetical protein
MGAAGGAPVREGIIMFKFKTLLAASAVGATALLGVGAQSASASCGVTIEADNDELREVTVDWEDSYVRTSTVVFGQRIAASWARISNYETDIASNASVSRAFTLDLPCNIDRQYKLEVEDGTNSWIEYHNEVGPSGSWTRSVNPVIDLED